MVIDQLFIKNDRFGTLEIPLSIKILTTLKLYHLCSAQCDRTYYLQVCEDISG